MEDDTTFLGNSLFVTGYQSLRSKIVVSSGRELINWLWDPPFLAQADGNRIVEFRLFASMGHEYTLMLNKAYNVLMREDERCKYDISIGEVVSNRRNFSRNRPGLDYYSTWNGPFRSQALFVDENACIGCRDCVHHASKTFMMDETLGCARVKVQFGDNDRNIEVSVDSCPVNCIHWVDSEELPMLEFLVKPQPKEGYGVFGGGWERPKNVFMAAKSFNKQLEQQKTNRYQHPNTSYEEETPAQAEARTYASKKIEKEKFSRLWNWAREAFGMNSGNAK
ncbi:hypothetical protein CsatB_020382 [Cannabis sativa]